MRKAENLIEIEEDVKVGNVILEKGDKIKVVENSYEWTVEEENDGSKWYFSKGQDFFVLKSSGYRQSETYSFKTNKGTSVELKDMFQKNTFLSGGERYLTIDGKNVIYTLASFLDMINIEDWELQY